MAGGLGLETNNTNRLPRVIGPPTRTLKENGMTEAEFSLLVERATKNQVLPIAARNKWRKAVGLVAETELPTRPTDWKGPPETELLPQEVLPVEDPTYRDKIKDCLSGKEKWEVAFPPRTPASLGLLRLRMKDLPTLYAGSRFSVADTLYKLRFINEYVMMLNMAVAHLVFSDKIDWLGWWEERGALRSGAIFERYSKEVSVALKSSVFSDDYLPFVEATGMSGFRLLPDPTFDVVKETRDAAEGFGLDHFTSDGLEKEWGWMDCVEVLTANPVGRKATFEEFVKDAGLWATSGASSYGKLFYSVEGKKEKVKARKLLLPYISSPEIIVDIAQRAETSINVAVIKSELSKIRIAVAGDLGFYMVWAYLHHLTGDVYDQWPGVTLAESPRQEIIRLWNMVNYSAMGYTGLPEDFKSFDKQPTNTEILAIGQKLLQCALEKETGVPDWLAHNALSGLINSTLATPNNIGPKAQQVFRVHNQLPSGIAITSAVGNAFNCVASESVIRLVEAWTGTKRTMWIVHLALRGDDSSFMVNSENWALLLAFAGLALNYVYAKGKIAAIRGATELLRVHFSIHGARGYPARIIPSLTQRKPWTNEPWDAEGMVRAWWVTCQSLERRRCRGLWLWERLTRVWARFRGLSSEVLALSGLDGGLGLGMPPVVQAKLTPGLHTMGELPGVQLQVAEWGIGLTKTSFERSGFALSTAEAEVLTKEKAISSLSTVDVHGVSGLAKDQYKLHLKEQRLVPGHISGFGPRFMHVLLTAVHSIGMLDTLDPWRDYVDIAKAQSFGKYGMRAGGVTQARELAQLREVKLETLLETDIAQDARMKARALRTGFGTALDWLIGKPPTVSYAWMHPQLVSAVIPVVAGLTETAIGYGEIVNSSLGSVYGRIAWEIGRAVCEQRLLGRLYSW